MLKPNQNKKGQKIWGIREKSSPFIRKKTAFFLGYPKFFWTFLFWSGFRAEIRGKNFVDFWDNWKVKTPQFLSEIFWPLITSENIGRFFQIFVAFSEYILGTDVILIQMFYICICKSRLSFEKGNFTNAFLLSLCMYLQLQLFFCFCIN